LLLLVLYKLIASRNLEIINTGIRVMATQRNKTVVVKEIVDSLNASSFELMDECDDIGSPLEVNNEFSKGIAQHINNLIPETSIVTVSALGHQGLFTSPSTELIAALRDGYVEHYALHYDDLFFDVEELNGVNHLELLPTFGRAVTKSKAKVKSVFTEEEINTTTAHSLLTTI
jgi:hypothetical protein